MLHGDNDLRSMKLPSGRNAFLEQVAELLQNAQQTASPAPASGQFDQLPKEIRYLAIREVDAAPPVILAVSEHDSPALREQTQAIVNASYPQQAPELEMLNIQTFSYHSTAGASGFTNTASANACTVWQCRKRGS